MAAPSGSCDGGARDSSTMSLTSMLDRHLESSSLSLPVCPESADHVLRELEAEGVDAEALDRNMSREPALVAAVLREANGAEFDALARIASIRLAVARLGEQRVASLMGEIATNSRLKSEERFLHRALHHTWKRSLAIALVAPAVAVRTGNDDLAGEAQLLGLLSDVGVLFLISALNAQQMRRNGPPPLTAIASRELIHQLQNAYGIRLLEQWNLPARQLAVLAGRPDGRDAQQQSLFLRVARQVVASIGLPPAGGEGGGADENELWEFAEALELSTVDVAALQVHAEDLVASLNAEASES